MSAASTLLLYRVWHQEHDDKLLETSVMAVLTMSNPVKQRTDLQTSFVQDIAWTWEHYISTLGN